MSSAWGHEWTVEIGAENRFFFEKDLNDSSEQWQGSLTLRPEYSHSWEDGRQVFTFIPFLRLDSLDDERTHFDIRELSWEKAWEVFELRLGIRKVFWGVTESRHLVDIINQTDFVESFDGEQKLGQPMANLAYISDYGTLDFFLLPVFRERTFSGEDGRFRFSSVVDTDNPIYESSAEETHLDWAIRWSHTLGDVDLGVSYFEGTNRDPRFVVENSRFRPNYLQTQKVGVDAQWTHESWLWKWESAYEDTSGEESFIAFVGGVEYTFVGAINAIDIGVLAEYLYDDRGVGFLSNFQNDLFVGSRWAFNDADDSDILFGVFVDTELGSSSYRVEASTRFQQDWKLSGEINVFGYVNSRDPLFFFRQDDYVQAKVDYYF